MLKRRGAGYIQVDEGFIETDERFSVGNNNFRLSAMVATSSLVVGSALLL